MLENYANYTNAGDLDGWLSLWNQRGVQMPPDAPARSGRTQIRAGMEPLFTQMTLEITITGIQDVIVYRDSGLTRCTYKLKMTPRSGGAPILYDGKALTIYARGFQGSWEIIYDCFNSNVPPP